MRAQALMMIVALAAMPAGAQLRTHAGYAVAREHVAHAVAEALEESGVAVAEPQVRLLSAVMANEPAPALEMRSAKLLSGRDDDANRQVAIKFACRVAGTCLPFYAVVDWPADAKLPTVIEPSAVATVRPAAKTKAPVVLRAGARATLLLDDGQLHMEIPVIALENASAGQSIRVASLDRKRTYTAQVVDAGLLKGAF